MTFHRILSILALAAILGGFAAPALAQDKAKDPTDGFFDIPKDPNAVEEPSYGVPAYLVTSALGGLGLFIVCKSARRG